MRILRQTLVLSQKNCLLFIKAPILSIIRALVIPIGLTLILCYLKHVTDPGENSEFSGIENSPTAIKDLSDALNAATTNKLVFVTNGLANDGVTPIINQVISQNLHGLPVEVVDDPNDLFDVCPQSIDGNGDCFATVIFTSINQTDVEYIIVLDDNLSTGSGDIKSHSSLLTDRVLPLQWAIESTIGNLSASSKPSEQLYSGFLGPFADQINAENAHNVFWFDLVYTFVAPLFSIILVGVVYHLATFVATERQTMVSELMAAQGVTIIPRILSNLGSFLALYLPGFIASSILLTQLLFLKTSDGILVFLTILAGISFTVSSHFIASFFGRGQLAGLYASVLCVALAFITLANSLSQNTPQGQILGLAIVFPPITWATLISDVARREYYNVPFTLDALDPQKKVDGYHVFAPYLYPIFFLLQIILYGLATYFVEKRWSVTRKYDTIDTSSDVALRVTNLSKTYNPKTKWYWPFGGKGGPVQAVQNLNLEVKKGSVTFLLGPNGGGKTTTLKCVAGMTSMDQDSRLELNAGGLVFGICPQINVFWDSLTVEEHIRIWRKLKTAAFGIHNPDDDDVLAECDLILKSKAEAKTLSGGQMRKLQLAIAFVGGSNVVCIDEASSGLDPLSRRNIWNIIQQGQSRRTTLITTHFLDEADILADHIAIIHKGKLVCEGPGTSLKSQYADSYLIREDSEQDSGEVAWRTLNSAEATRKLLELEAMSDEKTYSVVFPTLEQVFLKVTSDTMINDSAGDGVAGFVEEEENPDIIEQKIYALHNPTPGDVDLDVGHSIGILRQIWVLFKKRYILLQQRSNWISYGINLLIPIIVAAALTKFLKKMHPLQTCQLNEIILRNGSAQDVLLGGPPSYPVFAPLTAANPVFIVAYPATNESAGTPSAILGPTSAWSGAVQQDIYLHELLPYFEANTFITLPGTPEEQALESRSFVNSTSQMVQAIINAGFYDGLAIYAETPDNAIIYHGVDAGIAWLSASGMNVVTNRLANTTTTEGTARKVSTSLRTMRHITNNVDIRALPLTILLSLSFITAAAVSIIYPTYEKVNNVRALHYCNGVSPFALWFAYLLFDLQFIIVEGLIVFGCLFTGVLTNFWFGSSYMIGVFILFGIASYLGAYIVSLFVKKAAFAVAAVIHLLLYALYVVGDVMNQSFGAAGNRSNVYNILQYSLGLTSPAANLSRAFFIGLDVFGMLCGKYGNSDVSKKFSYDLFGSIYTNLLLQIAFLGAFLMAYEYGSAEWFRRLLIWRNRIPARLHYIVDSGDAAAAAQPEPREKNATGSTTQGPEILKVSRINKFFGRVFAAENVTFSISANETLALLGANGAGKTTVINMIRGELKPDYGDIYLDGVSVLHQPHKARLQMGVCPQDDAIDNLTVRQTLNFYAAVKGLGNIPRNVDRVLEALNISMYQSMPAKKLSGGTRRKLSVAIALLGNPRVLLLDEPSTGQDAGAKRILWKALQDISSNRAILLTTHSMEEAEALATNVAILHTKMLVTGTLPSLQASHGGAFCVRAVLVPGFDGRQAERLVREKFEDLLGLRVMNYVDSKGQISFNLPHDKKMMGKIMKAMEELKGEDIVPSPRTGGNSRGGGSAAGAQEVRIQVLREYTVTGPTLEEVFMNVARESGTAGGV
ncbi:hypothetical protein B7463_g6379, partial [Scytalidium lignicola]